MAKNKAKLAPSAAKNVAREQGYRTGYVQGVTTALFAAESGATREQLAAWIQQLQRWQLHPPQPPEWPPPWPEPRTDRTREKGPERHEQRSTR